MKEWTPMCSRDGDFIIYKNLNNVWIWQHKRAVKYNSQLGSNWTKSYSNWIETQLVVTKMCFYSVSIHSHMKIYCHVMCPNTKKQNNNQNRPHHNLKNYNKTIAFIHWLLPWNTNKSAKIFMMPTVILFMFYVWCI